MKKWKAVTEPETETGRTGYPRPEDADGYRPPWPDDIFDEEEDFDGDGTVEIPAPVDLEKIPLRTGDILIQHQEIDGTLVAMVEDKNGNYAVVTVEEGLAPRRTAPYFTKAEAANTVIDTINLLTKTKVTEELDDLVAEHSGPAPARPPGWGRF